MEPLAFGRRGHESSRVIFGAAALGAMRQEKADQILQLLLDHGVNHIDTAASYGDSELRVGPWMERHRDRFFLATKTGDRTADGARASVRRSLERLRVERVDLIQLHNLVDECEWETALGPGGALEALVSPCSATRSTPPIWRPCSRCAASAASRSRPSSRSPAAGGQKRDRGRGSAASAGTSRSPIRTPSPAPCSSSSAAPACSSTRPATPRCCPTSWTRRPARRVCRPRPPSWRTSRATRSSRSSSGTSPKASDLLPPDGQVL